MRRILVLRGGALGDFLVTLPALAALRRRWPAARLELAGNATAAQLALDRGLLDAAYSQHESRWSALYAPAPVPPALAAWLDGFDLVVNYWPDPDGELRRHFPRHAGQVFISADALPAQAPAAAHYLSPLHAIGCEASLFLHPLATPVPGGHTIAIHAGSGSPSKNWPLDRWRDLCRWLTQDERRNLLIIAGEADDAASLAPFGEVAVNLPLARLVERLSPCRLFLGHDSGVSHLAAACGVPCVLLFGPTDPAVWAPPAPSVRVLQRGPEMSALSLADVRRAVSAALAES